jgi:hypothetical protein
MARRSGSLTVVGAASAARPPNPPQKLGAAGMSLWRDVTAAYQFADPASYEPLFQACAAADRAETCRCGHGRGTHLNLIHRARPGAPFTRRPFCHPNCHPTGWHEALRTGMMRPDRCSKSGGNPDEP